jgi:hypothetical protein
MKSTALAIIGQQEISSALPKWKYSYFQSHTGSALATSVIARISEKNIQTARIIGNGTNVRSFFADHRKALDIVCTAS